MKYSTFSVHVCVQGLHLCVPGVGTCVSDVGIFVLGACVQGAHAGNKVCHV